MNVLIAYTPKFEGAANRIESLAREYGVEASIVALENSGLSSAGGMVHEIAPEITPGLVIALTEYSTCVIDFSARARVLKLSYSGAGGFRGWWQFNPYNPAAWLQEAHSYLVECGVPLLGSLLALLTMAAGVVSLTLLKSDIWRSCEVVGNSLELWQSCSGRRDSRDRALVTRMIDAVHAGKESRIRSLSERCKDRAMEFMAEADGLQRGDHRKAAAVVGVKGRILFAASQLESTDADEAGEGVVYFLTEAYVASEAPSFPEGLIEYSAAWESAQKRWRKKLRGILIGQNPGTFAV